MRMYSVCVCVCVCVWLVGVGVSVYSSVIVVGSSLYQDFCVSYLEKRLKMKSNRTNHISLRTCTPPRNLIFKAQFSLFRIFTLGKLFRTDLMHLMHKIVVEYIFSS